MSVPAGGAETTATVGEVIGQARVILRDPDGVRWNDAELLALVNAGVNRAFRKRSDLRSQASYKATSSGDVIPLDFSFSDPLAHYVAGLALAEGDNPGDAAISAMHIKIFDDALLG